MLGIFLVVIVALVLFVPRIREWLLEEIKTFSDFLLLNFLRRTSQFGSELNEDGKAEQKLFREQRLRNLRGLALRSKEAIAKKAQQDRP